MTDLKVLVNRLKEARDALDPWEVELVENPRHVLPFRHVHYVLEIAELRDLLDDAYQALGDLRHAQLEAYRRVIRDRDTRKCTGR